MSKLSISRWHAHLQGACAPATMHDWLADPGSLTKKLTARCENFRVRRLHQSRAPCLRDEAQMLQLSRPQQVWEREVLLYCDAQPMVFAHTVVPLTNSATDWPLFSALGERSLGTTLFGDPLVQRGALHFARLSTQHRLYQRALTALRSQAFSFQITGDLFARRCLYRRKRGSLLVTEVFFPWLPGFSAKPTLELVSASMPRAADTLVTTS